MDVGITGYGAYIPRYRIKVEDICKVWGANAESVKSGLNVAEKAVPAQDEDTATISVMAARNALLRAEIDPQDIGAVYVGSESHPYAVKPTATIVAEAINATPSLTAADFEFACKAGTAAIQVCMGLVGSGMVEYGLAIGADTAQGAPGDPLEYTAAGGGAAYLIGKKNLLAQINDTYSYTTDTPDFWRREGASYPSHGGRFTGGPAYFMHIESATRGLLEKTGTKVEDYAHIVFHQPNGKFPLKAAKDLGVKKEQIETGLVVTKIGNTYSGCSLLGLSRVLDKAKPGERLLVTSFGSGAGGDSFSLTVTDRIEKTRDKAEKTDDYINAKEYIEYSAYIKHRRKLKRS